MVMLKYINDFISPMKRNHSSMTLEYEFSVVETHFDETECEIEQVAVLKCGAIIVTDIKNGFAKAFSVDGKYLDSAENVGRVFGITATGDNTFVVTVPGGKKMAFYKLFHDKLHLQCLIDTDRRYFGIGVLPNKNLIAGTKYALNVLTPMARNIGSMTSEFQFENPYHIRVTKNGKVVVADSGKKCIVVFDEEGCMEFHVHIGHNRLRGFDLMDRVIIFVNKLQEDISMIHIDELVITNIKADKNHLIEPSAICFLKNGKVIICEKERVKIFKIDDYELLIRRKPIQSHGFKSWLQLKQFYQLILYLELVITLLLIVYIVCYS